MKEICIFIIVPFFCCITILATSHLTGSCWCPWHGKEPDELQEAFTYRYQDRHKKGSEEEGSYRCYGGCWLVLIFSKLRYHFVTVCYHWERYLKCYNYYVMSDVKGKWEKSSWGRKLIVQKRRAALNDFDRFKLMLAKIKVCVMWSRLLCSRLKS